MTDLDPITPDADSDDADLRHTRLMCAHMSEQILGALNEGDKENPGAKFTERALTIRIMAHGWIVSRPHLWNYFDAAMSNLKQSDCITEEKNEAHKAGEADAEFLFAFKFKTPRYVTGIVSNPDGTPYSDYYLPMQSVGLKFTTHDGVEHDGCMGSIRGPSKGPQEDGQCRDYCVSAFIEVGATGMFLRAYACSQVRHWRAWQNKRGQIPWFGREGEHGIRL